MTVKRLADLLKDACDAGYGGTEIEAVQRDLFKKGDGSIFSLRYITEKEKDFEVNYVQIIYE